MKFPRIPRIPGPLLILLASLLAYGSLIPLTGFFWDDWPFAWISNFLGPGEFVPAFVPFRPFLGPIFVATTSLIPEHPLLWQAFGVLIRLLTGLSAWFALTRVWPARPQLTLTASLLFLVFPGYSQQWVALTHINQELIPLIFYLLSFGFTARALRERERFIPLTLAALALQIGGIFPTEYFFGMEIFRFFFIWAIVMESTQGFLARAMQTLKYWWPYLLVWVGNAAWLIYYYNFGAYNSYALGPSEDTAVSAATLTSLFQAWVDALYKAGPLSWTLVFKQISMVFPGASAWLALALITVTFVIFAMFMLRNSRDGKGTEQPSSASPVGFIMLVGILGILAGRVPSWAAGLPLTLQSSYDRFMVSMMLGAALLLAGLIELIRHERARTLTASLLIALAVGSQFLSGNIFRRDWEGQRELYWQFAWRIPALEPGTVIFTNEMPLDYETDLSITAPLNWIYAPNYQRGDNLPYVVLYTEKRIGGVALPDLEPDTPITIPYRTVTFRGSVGASITVYAPRNGCLRVLDPVYANEAVYAREPRTLTDTIAVSNPARILIDAPAPEMPASIFGSEPPHTWCYHYTKAELARQHGDWQTVAALGDDAIRLGYGASDPVEWLPFIEAYAHVGNWDEAERLSRLVVEMDARLRKGMCQVWGRIRLGTSGQVGGPERSEAMLAEFECGP